MKLYASLFAMLLLMLGTSQCARADDGMDGVAYFTMEEAAHAALVDAYNCSEGRRECGGVIYRYEHKANVPYVLYFYTEPVTQNRPFNVSIAALTLPAPAYMRKVADYHNHLCLGVKQLVGMFSFGDILSNQGLHTIGYMLDGCTGNIHRFDPAQDAPDDVAIHYQSGRELDLTGGHVVGWVNVYRNLK